MADPQIVSYSIQQLMDDPQALSAYTDPNDYLKESGPRWVEFLASNPRARFDDLAIVLTIVDGEVVGNLRGIPIELCIQGATIRSTALRAFYLSDAWHNGGSGGMMLLRYLSLTRSVIASGRPDEGAESLYHRVGLKEIGPLSRYVYFNSTKYLLETASRGIPLIPKLSVVLDPLARIYYRIRSTSDKSDLTFEAVEQFSGELDQVLDSRDDDHIVRQVADLNWTLHYSPSLSAYEIKRGQSLIGYCLIRIHENHSTSPRQNSSVMRVVSLLDYYLVETGPEVLNSLAHHIIKYSSTQDAEIVSIQTNQPMLIGCLKRLGFVRSTGNNVLLKVPTKTDVDPDRWHLTEAQGDVLFSALDFTSE
ncbi:MAG: hypothetical protein HQ478_09085 [Chloroflexi bacterium]|nr:hypothetical protein [Chloroflexota bacterium]